MLHEEVGSLSEGTCGDMLVLPIYAALPPELQARCSSFAPYFMRSFYSLAQLTHPLTHLSNAHSPLHSPSLIACSAAN